MKNRENRNGFHVKAGPPKNEAIAELLAIEAESAKHYVARAFRRASRRAFLWPEEAAELVASGRSLTDLQSVGPYLAKVIAGWLAKPPEVPAPPELRQGFLTFAQAEQVLATKPALRRDLCGDLQMHTTWSDGEGSVQEMAEAADERGYEYIAITDHAKGLKIAGGIDEAQLRRQAHEIAGMNAALGAGGRKLRVLRSIELNLNPQGEGDMESAALAKLDLVLGCFHSSLRKKEDQTARYLAALRNPDIQILGHPKGRIYNFRLGLNADWPRVFGLAAKLDKAVEIDCYQDRQDLKLDLVRLAKQAGCRISLGTDSHGPSQLRFIDFGLASAALAGVKRERILNFMSREELLHWAASVREKQAVRVRGK
ncbi:MAG TPA: PHP domain-containing protein [Candidatus Acidoferrales bacterium]|jgi:histidinol phosphatase-like PHP family hydrolase|nr:PHP domain-containing protein [Candidatus Acidoferrales bacterium]